MAHDLPSESRISAVALQLARTMELQGESEASEDMISIWMANLGLSSFSSSESREILSRAETLRRSKTALQPSKSATVPQSISLWDQFSSFSERVMWMHVESAKDDAQRLDLLEKVDHIDDILSDWKDAKQLLQKGLAQSDESYLNLHCKWFGHCQATAEYQNIRMDLCSNILFEVRRQFGSKTWIVPTDPTSFSTNEEMLFKFLQTWKSMWIKIITSGGYDEERADSMMLQVLVLNRNLSEQRDGQEAMLALLPAHFLALVDTRADWYRCWLDETPVHRILTVLTRSSFLPDLLSRCRYGGVVAPWLDAADTMEQKLKRILHRQSLAILISLLTHLRVRMFPWNQLEPRGSSMPRNALLQELTFGDNSEPLFPTPVPFAGVDVLDLARVLFFSRDLGDNWLVEQVNSAIKCLFSGCAINKHIFSQLQEIGASLRWGPLVGSVALEAGFIEQA